MTIQPGDFSKAARVQVCDGHRRPWYRMFRRTPVYRTVWAGYIHSWEQSVEGTSMSLMDDSLRRRLSVRPVL